MARKKGKRGRPPRYSANKVKITRRVLPFTHDWIKDKDGDYWDYVAVADVIGFTEEHTLEEAVVFGEKLLKKLDLIYGDYAAMVHEILRLRQLRKQFTREARAELIAMELRELL